MPTVLPVSRMCTFYVRLNKILRVCKHNPSLPPTVYWINVLVPEVDPQVILWPKEKQVTLLEAVLSNWASKPNWDARCSTRKQNHRHTETALLFSFINSLIETFHPASTAKTQHANRVDRIWHTVYVRQNEGKWLNVQEKFGVEENVPIPVGIISITDTM